MSRHIDPPSKSCPRSSVLTIPAKSFGRWFPDPVNKLIAGQPNIPQNTNRRAGPGRIRWTAVPRLFLLNCMKQAFVSENQRCRPNPNAGLAKSNATVNRPPVPIAGQPKCPPPSFVFLEYYHRCSPPAGFRVSEPDVVRPRTCETGIPSLSPSRGTNRNDRIFQTGLRHPFSE